MSRLLNVLLGILRLLENPQPQQSGAVENRTTGHQERTGRAPIVAELRIPQSAMAQYEATQRAQSELEQRKFRLDRRRLCIERFTAVIVVLTTIGAFGNLWLLNESMRLSRVATNAARDAADAANASATIAAAQMVTEQRAWLVVTRMNVGWIPNGNAFVTATLANIGQTPAKSVSGCIRVQVLTSGQSPDFDYTPGKGNACYMQFIPVINPRATAVPFGNLTALKPTKDRQRIIVDDNIGMALANGKAHIVMHGRLTFRDVFNIDHWIQFCDWPVPDNAQIPNQGEALPGRLVCSAYNDFDNNTRETQKKDQPQ